MPDILLDRQELRSMRANLQSLVEEFQLSRDLILRTLVGRPDDRDALAGAVQNFDDDWELNRERLTDRLRNLEEHLGSIVQNWDDWENEIAGRF